ncbi:MAG: hypothetical protein AAF218_03480 [Pseudomonadota bacterium]
MALSPDGTLGWTITPKRIERPGVQEVSGTAQGLATPSPIADLTVASLRHRPKGKSA